MAFSAGRGYATNTTCAGPPAQEGERHPWTGTSDWTLTHQAKALIQVIRAIPKNRHLCLEEGTHSSWLYKVFSPHVQEIVVIGVSQSRGQKTIRRRGGEAWGSARRAASTSGIAL